LAPIIDEIVEQLGDPATPAEVAHAIEDSFEFFRRYDGMLGRDGRATMVASAERIVHDIAALEDILDATIVAVSALERGLGAAPPLLLEYGFRPPPARDTVQRADVSALLAASFPSQRWSRGGQHA
jgi:hypothetical protein